MISIRILDKVGAFAENKDIARDIREDVVMPTLEKGGEVSLDFEGVDDATQSFIHAIISESFRKYGPGVLDKIIFKNCNERIKEVISLVSAYMQESL